MNKSCRLLMLLVLLPVLAACASDDGGKAAHKMESDIPAKHVKADLSNLICPQVAILKEAQEKYDYGDEKPAPDQLVAAARMTKVDGTCEYHDNGIDVDYTLHIEGAKGPRLGGTHEDFSFFTAVVDPSDDILNRQLMTVSFDFKDGATRGESDQKMHVFIPLSGDALQAGPDYRVLMGFERRKN
ncbi:MAG: hypothetical protein KGI97_03305 [Alphaproteobacteria bacterium]|nr:hypothetical protein [Alphaproteobacteria bacterium]